MGSPLVSMYLCITEVSLIIFGRIFWFAGNSRQLGTSTACLGCVATRLSPRASNLLPMLANVQGYFGTLKLENQDRHPVAWWI